MNFYAMTKKGKKEKNEDNYLAENIENLHVFAVADGLGGHSSGEKASGIAIVEVKEMVKRKPSHRPKDLLEKAIEKANNEIYFQNQELKMDMATTLVACILEPDGKCTIANLGDSRAYLTNGEIWHTKDHNFVQELVDDGVIGEEEAFKHPNKNIVSKALGLENEVKADFYEFKIENRTLLLCSDGIHDYVRNERISEILKKNQNELEKTCDMLIEETLDSGSPDNITVVIARKN